MSVRDQVIVSLLPSLVSLPPVFFIMQFFVVYRYVSSFGELLIRMLQLVAHPELASQAMTLTASDVPQSRPMFLDAPNASKALPFFPPRPSALVGAEPLPAAIPPTIAMLQPPPVGTAQDVIVPDPGPVPPLHVVAPEASAPSILGMEIDEEPSKGEAAVGSAAEMQAAAPAEEVPKATPEQRLDAMDDDCPPPPPPSGSAPPMAMEVDDLPSLSTGAPTTAMEDDPQPTNGAAPNESEPCLDAPSNIVEATLMDDRDRTTEAEVGFEVPQASLDAAAPLAEVVAPADEVRPGSDLGSDHDAHPPRSPSPPPPPSAPYPPAPPPLPPSPPPSPMHPAADDGAAVEPPPAPPAGDPAEVTVAAEVAEPAMDPMMVAGPSPDLVFDLEPSTTLPVVEELHAAVAGPQPEIATDSQGPADNGVASEPVAASHDDGKGGDDVAGTSVGEIETALGKSDGMDAEGGDAAVVDAGLDLQGVKKGKGAGAKGKVGPKGMKVASQAQDRSLELPPPDVAGPSEAGPSEAEDLKKDKAPNHPPGGLEKDPLALIEDFQVCLSMIASF